MALESLAVIGPVEPLHLDLGDGTRLVAEERQGLFGCLIGQI